MNNEIHNKMDQISLRILHKFFVENLKISYENLIILGLELFYFYFVTDISQIIEKYPKNMETNGHKFWNGYKKFPQIIEMDFTDLYFNNFVVSVANIYSHILNLSFS